MTCGIYCLKHKATGKQYIGQSIDIGARWKQHRNCREGSFIGSAIAKHGWSAFNAVVLEECAREHLNDAEAAWIAKLGSLSPAGYNLRTGGGQNAAFSEDVLQRISEATRRAMTPEMLERRRQSMKGIPKSAEWRAAMSERMKANSANNARLLKMACAQSAETREKIAASKRGVRASDATRAKMRDVAKADGRADRMHSHANYMSEAARAKMATSAKAAPREREAATGRWKAPAP